MLKPTPGELELYYCGLNAVEGFAPSQGLKYLTEKDYAMLNKAAEYFGGERRGERVMEEAEIEARAARLDEREFGGRWLEEGRKGHGH